MKKKNYLLLATAAIALVACTADDDLSAGKSTTAQGDGAIVFNMNTSATTRGEKSHTESATALGNEFIVWGEKTTATEEPATAATADNIVFKNYRVQYGTGTAGKTVSNTDDWEYVGLTPYKASTTAGEEYVYPSILTDNESAKQTIKYWDDNATSYTFTAVSADQNDISGGKVKITKTTSADNNGTAKGKGYTIELADAAATVGDIYVSDRKVVTKTNGNFSHSVVKMEFRNFQSKIRFGIYENVPGYRVVITGIKYNNGTNDIEHTGTSGTFGVEGNFVLAGSKTTGGTNTSYTVTYDANNHAQVDVTAGNSQSYYDTGGTNWLKTSFTLANQATCIGETAADATYDKTSGQDKKAYTAILPNPGNTQNLKLQIK